MAALVLTFAAVVANASPAGAQNCIDDAFEANDDQASATPLARDTQISAQICADNDDWYTFDVLAGEAINVQLLATHANGDVDIALVDPNGEARSFSSSVTDDESISITADVSGAWAVEVIGFAGAENSYSLTVTDALNACVDDEFEDNDDQASATPLTGTQVFGQICSGDNDWYSLDAVAGEVIRVQLFVSDAEGDIDIGLFDPSAIERDFSSSTTDDELITFTADVSGTWAIQVNGFSGDQNVYALITSSCTDDGFEPNDDPVSATPITLGTPVSGQICSIPENDDWYSFDVALGETIIVDAQFAHADGDIDITLFDPSGVPLASSSSVTDDELIIFTAGVSGTWAVEVTGFAGAENTYDLAVTTSQEPPLLCNGLLVTVNLALGETPTEGDDVIRGTANDDIINGLAGADVICALQGNDTINGGDGFDRVFAGQGDDRIDGGIGNDLLVGGPGNDTIIGGNGNDRIQGGDGVDTLEGSGGLDRLAGGNGNDTIRGGAGADELLGNLGRDLLFGDAGDDVLRGGAWLDTMDGGLGTDGCTLTDPSGNIEPRTSCETGVFGL